jgi:hypothetical protein
MTMSKHLKCRQPGRVSHANPMYICIYISRRFHPFAPTTWPSTPFRFYASGFLSVATATSHHFSTAPFFNVGREIGDTRETSAPAHGFANQVI